MKQIDVTIVGAGAVGLALANRLALEGFSIAVVDSRPAPLPEPEPTGRVVALNLASLTLLSKIGLAQSASGAPFEKIQVWQDKAEPAITFNAFELGRSQLGQIVSVSKLVEQLWQYADQHDNIQLLPKTSPKACIQTNECVTLDCGEGKRITSTLLVGADGAGSWIRQQAGIGVKRYDYHQKAIIAVVETERPHQRIAKQRFLETGVLAFLPLIGANQAAIVWSLDDTLAEIAMGWSDQEFAEHLSDAMDAEVGTCFLRSKKQMFPLAAQHSTRYIENRLLLMGDAAHTVHPLAGQGMNMGFADVQCLVELLLQTKQSGRDLKQAVLSRYQWRRKSANTVMLMTMNLFHRGFRASGMRSLAGFGLTQVDKSQCIKTWLMKQACGIE